MIQPAKIFLVHRLDRAERTNRKFGFRALVNHGALISRVGQFCIIVFPKILSQFRSNAFEKVSKSAQNGEVRSDCAAGLKIVLNTENHEQTR